MTEKILISVLINNESKFAKKLSKDENLTEVRKKLGAKLPNDSKFTLPDGSEIDVDDENDYNLSEILKDDKVYMKSQQCLSEKPTPITEAPKKKNEPIPEVKKLAKKVI